MPARPDKHAHSGLQTGRVSAQRLDALLSGAARAVGIDELGWATGLYTAPPILIERLLDQDVAQGIRRRLGQLIVEHSDSRLWELLPADRLAYCVVAPAKIARLIHDNPGFVGLPRDMLEMVLRDGLSLSAGQRSSVPADRISVSGSPTEGAAPINLYVNPMSLTHERIAASSILESIAQQPVRSGPAAIPIGATTPDQAHLQSTQNIMGAAREFVAGIGVIPLQEVTISYPGGIRHPLY